MPNADFLKKGSHNAICDRCGFKFKAEELRLDGYTKTLLVCKGCWDDEHPQEKVVGKEDKQSVDNPRPDKSPDTFEPPQYTPPNIPGTYSSLSSFDTALSSISSSGIY